MSIARASLGVVCIVLFAWVLTIPRPPPQNAYFDRQSLVAVFFWLVVPYLDGRKSLALVLAESLARVVAAVRITGVLWRSYLPPNTGLSPYGPCLRCAAIRIARLAFIHAACVPRLRKIPVPIKIKSALPLPPPQNPKYPPPKTRNFMDMGFPAERTHFSRRP